MISFPTTYVKTYRYNNAPKSWTLLGGVVFPSFRQLNYFYYKTVKQQNLIISREGKDKFMRDYRVMLGNGIRDLCIDARYGS